jgi:hypothetical protein
MAGFCRNCGSPLADGQGFCTGCGTRVGNAPANAAAPAPPVAPPAAAPPPAAPPVYATPPVQAAPVAAAPRPAGMSTLAKILIAIVIIFVAFGALASVVVIYIGHRVHEKATELGLNRSDSEREVSDAQLHGIDGCKLLPKAAVSAAVHMDVVRAENSNSDPGCTYSVAGDPADLTAKHLTAMHKNEINQQEQNNVQDFAKSIFKSGGTNGPSEHPGEAPVIAYSIDNNAAQLQMKLNRATLGRLGPVGLVAIPGLGDEAFDAYGAMLFVRKGDKLVRIIYTGCPCAQEDVLPLARTIAAGL